MLLPSVLAVFHVVFVFLLSFVCFCRVERLVDADFDVASSDAVGLVLGLDEFGRGLEAHFSSFSCGKEVPPHTSLASVLLIARGELIVNSESLGRSRRGPFTSGCVRGLFVFPFVILCEDP